MKPAFEDKNLWNDFKEELLSWKGTPYRHMQCAKGQGGDCTFFLADVFHKLKIFKKVERPKYYPKNWFLHTTEDIIRDRLRDNFCFNTADGFLWQYHEEKEKELIEGDLLLFILRPSITVNHHTAIYLGRDQMFHGTMRRTFDVVEFSRWSKYMTSFYRLYRVEK